MVRTGKALAVVLLMIGMSGLGWNLATATAAPSEVVPYGAGAYRYQQVPTGGGAATFSNVSFDDTAFSVGDAPFGHAVPEFGCALAPATPWSPNTDLLVRRAVSLPAGTTDVVIHIAIDNDIQLFWNGTSVGSYQHEGCAVQDSIEVPIPSGLLTAGDNVLAVRASDRGGESFLDLRTTANLPPDCASVTTDQTTLWPPNHNFRVVTASGGVDPEGESVALAIASVTQDEPLDFTGDGHTAPDADNDALPANQVRLRAERSGNGDGRVYRVEVVATDSDGASCSKTISIGVPHDQGSGPTPIDTTAVVVDSFGSAPSLVDTTADAPTPSVNDRGRTIEVQTPDATPPQTPVSPDADDAEVRAVAVATTAEPSEPKPSPAPTVPPISAPPDSPTAPAPDTHGKKDVSDIESTGPKQARGTSTEVVAGTRGNSDASPGSSNHVSG
ncbi:MAG: hypothetical protein E6G39_08880 [Actinobacteria bacterium]|nr:MAG: hypothetical protein E6G39_08880 [Actinomycetota bacterium]